jgi:hypothetical protein
MLLKYVVFVWIGGLVDLHNSKYKLWLVDLGTVKKHILIVHVNTQSSMAQWEELVEGQKTSKRKT